MDLHRLVHGAPKSLLTKDILQLVPHSPIIRNLLIFVTLFYQDHVLKDDLQKLISQLFDLIQRNQTTSLNVLERIIPEVPWKDIPLILNWNAEEIFQRLGVKGISPLYPIEQDSHVLIESFQKAAGYMLPVEEIKKIPFFSAFSLDFYSKERFILASELFQPEDGLTPEMILTSPFIYLTHAINPEGILEQILQTNALYTPQMLNSTRTDQYPGIYFYPNTINRRNAHENMRLDIIFVFSVALLKRKGWHIRRDESYGNVGESTWDYLTLPQYLRSHYNDHPFQELIMHDMVPLDYLEIILISDTFETNDQEIYQESMEILEKFNYPVMKVSEFKKLPLYKKIKNLYKEDPISSQEPNFCYDNQGGDMPVDLSIKNIEYTLLNCGYNNQEVQNYLQTKTKRELIQLIDARQNKKYLPVYHPPY